MRSEWSAADPAPDVDPDLVLAQDGAGHAV